MNKNTFTTVKLTKGEMNVYDFGSVKLHAYKTNDFLCDEVFVVEKNGKAVIIESPCFFDNCKELEQYLKDIEVKGYAYRISRSGCDISAGGPEIRYAECRGLF